MIGKKRRSFGQNSIVPSGKWWWRIVVHQHEGLHERHFFFIPRIWRETNLSCFTGFADATRNVPQGLLLLLIIVMMRMLVLVPHELIGIRNATGKNPVGIRRVFSYIKKRVNKINMRKYYHQSLNSYIIITSFLPFC
jgi:hypothetical protein